MQYVEYLTLACFVAGAVVSGFGLATIGLYLFAAGVALAIFRAIAGEAAKNAAENDSEN
jgi:hypothetical protein